MKKLTAIPVNIWDDYYDDGYVPEGKFQFTHMYIEEYDVLSEEKKEGMMILVLEHLKTLDLTGVEIDEDGVEIYFKHLTHERREKLVVELNNAKLTFNGIPYEFYSES